MMYKSIAATSVLAASLLINTVYAQTVNPNGIYFNSFVNAEGNVLGIPSGVELFQVMPGADPTIDTDLIALIESGAAEFSAVDGATELSDILGGGFLAQFSGSDTLTISAPNSAIVVGALQVPSSSPDANAITFTDPDSYNVTIQFGPDFFDFTSTRIPFTDAGFPLVINNPVTSDSPLSGRWAAVEIDVDPQTGDILDGDAKTYRLRQNGNTLEIDDLNGFSFSGLFATGRQVGVRIIQDFADEFVAANPDVPVEVSDRTALTPIRFESFAGTETSISDNHVLAEIVFTDINNFEATVITQTVNFLGLEEVAVKRIVAERKRRLVPGDLNRNGRADFRDLRKIIRLASADLSEGDDGYNLLADINNDGSIDVTDILAFQLDLIKRFIY